MTVTYLYQFAHLPYLMEKMRSQLRIAVLYGGDNRKENAVLYRTHHVRSWKSYEAVAADIQKALLDFGFRHVVLLPDDRFLADRLQQENIHFAWLNTGGVQGNNPLSHAPGLLEMLGIPYYGHNPLQVTVLDNKHLFKYMLQCLGIRTSPFVVWNGAKGPFVPQQNADFQKVFGNCRGPFIVKPVSGRASLLVHFVQEVEGLNEVVQQVYQMTHDLVLIERYLPGREFCSAVYGEVSFANGEFVQHQAPPVFAKVERVFGKEEKLFTSMDHKQIDRERIRALDPHHDANLEQELVHMTRQVFCKCHFDALVRLDLRQDEQGRLHLLEANPKPDLKKPTDRVISIVCHDLEERGLSYTEFIISLFADRIHHLFLRQSHKMAHLVPLLGLKGVAFR